MPPGKTAGGVLRRNGDEVILKMTEVFFYTRIRLKLTNEPPAKEDIVYGT